LPTRARPKQAIGGFLLAASSWPLAFSLLDCYLAEEEQDFLQDTSWHQEVCRRIVRVALPRLLDRRVSSVRLRSKD
jgi:hypothetical protein